MAINKKRALQFQRDMQDLQDKIGFDEFYEAFKANLLDKLARGDIDGETIRSFTRQVRPIFDERFIRFVNQSFQAYNETQALVNAHYGDIGPDIHRELEKIRAIERVNLNQLGDYKETTIRDIAKQLRQGIRAGDKLDAIAQRISAIDDRAKTYANTIARTQVKSYGQAMKTEKARLGRVFFYTYIGIRRDTTRQFCGELIRQSDPTFHVNDIRKMSNGQMADVLTNRGGWRCHHDWEPDPFRKEDGYSVSFYSLTENKRILTLARSQFNAD